LVLSESTVDFPLTWVGFTRERSLTLRNTGAASRLLALHAEPPFFVDSKQLEAPGGATVLLAVRFRPPMAGAQAGTLAIDDGFSVHQAELSGEAKAPPSCPAS